MHGARESRGERSLHRREAAVAVALFAVAMVAFALYAWSLEARGRDLLLALAVFGVVFLPIPALGVARWRGSARRWLQRGPVPRTALLLAVPAILHLVHGPATGAVDTGFLWQYAVYAGVPAALVLHASRDVGDPLRAPGRTLGAVLVLWVLLDFGWVTPFRVPAGEEGLNLMRLLVLVLTLVLFVVCAPVRDLGYTFRISRGDAGRAFTALVAMAVVLVPLGLGIGFLEYGWVPFDPLEWAVMAVALYFATTLHEEFLFRGLVQNTVEKTWGGPRAALWGLVVGSVVFGVVHLNNPPAPNYAYVLMAGLAGTAYGWVWLVTRKVTVSALTHLAVNWIWMLALRGG